MAFAQCGVAPNQASVLGNIKAFNSYRKMRSSGVKDSLYHTAAKHQVLIAGSIYENELDHYINLFKELKREFPSLKLVLCPRFFEWKTKLIDKVKKLGYSYGVWDEPLTNVADPHKEIVTKFQSLLDNNDIVTVFVMGTLFHLCALSDIYYLGGTFVPVGGHNLLDSASWGSPMVVGPHYYMTKHIADDLEEAGALIKVSKGKELLEVTRKLLSNDEKTLSMREKAKKWIKKEYEFVERQVCRLITMLLNGKEKY